MTKWAGEIGDAHPAELDALPAIEARAANAFSSEDLPPALAAQTTSIAALRLGLASRRLLVARSAGGRVMGFVLLEQAGADAVLAEVDVDPSEGRRGVGRLLVEAACERAASLGHRRIVLSTFREVPWNAPFYRRLGFVELPETETTDALRSLREDERDAGFDLARRLLMARPLEGDAA